MRGKDLIKIVVATGVGSQRAHSQFDTSFLPEAIKGLAAITGQKPSQCQAKKSIASFKIRAGNLVGLKVTLRGKRMKEFLYRMVNVALPRVRDFRGINPEQIDKGGNLTIGFRDYSVFPEVVPEDSKHDLGLQVTLVSGVNDHQRAIEHFRTMGIPLMEKK
jgi:large subunit ribosomal protein L5